VAYHDIEPANQGGYDYRAGEGVDIETGHAPGVTNVAYVREGEFLKYSVDTTAAGQYTLVLRAANPDATAKAVKVYLDGVPAGQVLVAKTGDWTAYADFAASTTLTIPAGRHVVTLAFEGINRVNLDWLSLTAGPAPTPTTPVTTAVTPQTTPFGPGNFIPGRVQAENFDRNGAGPAYSDTTLANEGGAYRPTESVDLEYDAGIQSYNVGWIRTGEYLIYTVKVREDGTYTAKFNAANPDTTNKPVDVYVDGVKAGTVQIGKTGSFRTYKQFTLPVALKAGTHQVKIAFPSQRFNLDYIEFALGGNVVPSSTSTTLTSSTTSSPATGKATFVTVPSTARRGTAFKFTVTPAPGKSIRSAWWSFDSPAHMNTWNSRTINPTFYYPKAGTYSPYVELTYTDGSTEAVHRVNYIRST
jgi:uncharacterized protein YegP (UPF0339 family)